MNGCISLRPWRSRSAAAGAILIAICVCAPQSAADYWVSIGSYRLQDTAEAVRDTAARQLSEGFRQRVVDTPDGRFFRVYSGPFQTRATAEAARAQAAAGGYPGAWVFSSASNTAVVPGITPTVSATSTTRSVSASGDYRDSGDYPDYSQPYELPELPPLDDFPDSEPLVTQRMPIPALVREAPPGYQLNRMYRDP